MATSTASATVIPRAELIQYLESNDIEYKKTKAVFTDRESLNQFLDTELAFSKNCLFTVTVSAIKSYTEMMPKWKATDIPPILSKFELYNQVLKTSLSQGDTHTTYSRDIHSHILQSLVLCNGFIPTVEFLRYRLSQETEPKPIAFLEDDIDLLFHKNVHWWKLYKAYLETLVPGATQSSPVPEPAPAAPVQQVPEAAPAPASQAPQATPAVQKYLAHNTFHLRSFGYHIGLPDDAIREPLRRAVATHGKDKVLCKLYYLLSVYTNERSPSHKALQRDVTIVSAL